MLTILNYNENKVKEGVAKCILQNSFGCPVDSLNFYDKLNGFESFMGRNRRATSKAVHISLNFHPDEKLSESTLKEIAMEYMEKIGFGNQPYLVYQHLDAGHPHIHVVTTNIQRDGKRIILFRIGKYESEKARKSIENQYKLIEAAGRKQEVNTLETGRVTYGKSQLRRSISNIVERVRKNYKFTSLPEFNAVLSQFNIVAERGREESIMFKEKGLRYRILDGNGNKIGVPIKASIIPGMPTLPNLEIEFKLNERPRLPYKGRIIKCIDVCFGNKTSMTKSAFVSGLAREGIYVLFRQNEEGRIYGVTFVDNTTKVVFNGSDLGKAYSANAITERLTNLSAKDSVKIQPATIPDHPDTEHESDLGVDLAIKDLMIAKQFDYSSPDSAMKRRQKRKKKKGRSI